MSDTLIPTTRPTPWKLGLMLAPIALLGLLGLGLKRDPTSIPSVLIGHHVPQFELSKLDGTGTVRLSDYLGKPLVINFWASWCTSCREEHETLLRLGHEARVQMLGVNHRDSLSLAQRFEREHGAFPYSSVADARGRTGMDFGVYGLPETFFVAADGTVVARHLGPLTEEAVALYFSKMGAAQ
jgi:cytochrome c biogenesis protein CcmG/thiol:disulfide interchange protein DsbE